jgi:hypothetical protein
MLHLGSTESRDNGPAGGACRWCYIGIGAGLGISGGNGGGGGGRGGKEMKPRQSKRHKDQNSNHYISCPLIVIIYFLLRHWIQISENIHRFKRKKVPMTIIAPALSTPCSLSIILHTCAETRFNVKRIHTLSSKHPKYTHPTTETSYVAGDPPP